jgi:hypothetical protein
MKKIIDFWASSYHSDRIAFIAELISFVLTVGASLTLAITASDPDMRIVYPFFFLGSIAGLYGYYRRKLAWPMMLTTWFIFVNIFGFAVAMSWW